MKVQGQRQLLAGTISYINKQPFVFFSLGLSFHILCTTVSFLQMYFIFFMTGRSTLLSKKLVPLSIISIGSIPPNKSLIFSHVLLTFAM